MCLSTGGEGVCLSACWDANPPRDQADIPQDQADTPLAPGRPPEHQADPPGPDTPPGTRQTPLGSRLQHTVYYKWLVHILLECILV